MKKYDYEKPKMVIEVLPLENIICTSSMTFDPENPSGGGGSTGWDD